MMLNCTPHAINIVDSAEYNASVRKHIRTSVTKTVKVIAPSGKLLNAKIVRNVADPIDGIPTVKSEYPSVDELPEGADFVVVSAMYVAARRELGLPTEKLLTVGDTVYDSVENPKPIGVLNLSRN